MSKLKHIGPLFIIIAALLWSFDGILRRSLYSLPPTLVVFWEHLLGLIILFPFIISRIKEIKSLTKKEFIAILIVSLFSGALGTIFYTAALGKVNYIQFSVVVLLQQLQPIWAISTAAIVLKEKIRKSFLIWAVLAIVGTYFVTFKDLKINLGSGQTLTAALLALTAGLLWGSSTSFSKIILKKVSFQLATLLRFFLAPIFALLFLIYFGQFNLILTPNRQQWSSLLLITLFTGVFAVLIYYYGLKKTEAKISAVCELVWPVSAIFIDYFYFKQFLSVTQIIGVCVVLFSIYKVTRSKNETKKMA